MNNYEKRIGKFKKVEFPEDIIQAKLQQEYLWVEEGNDVDENYYEGLLFDSFYEKYFKMDGYIWEFIENKEVDYNDSYCDLIDNKDGTYSFTTQFYNGGTCENEIIKEAFVKLNKG